MLLLLDERLSDRLDDELIERVDEELVNLPVDEDMLGEGLAVLEDRTTMTRADEVIAVFLGVDQTDHLTRHNPSANAFNVKQVITVPVK